eukprot:scaffold42322_cov25-Cyclotella_meneghiniana.AAC.2
MRPKLAILNQRKLTIDGWAKNLSRHLLLFIHRQWTYRNSTVHYKPSEGKTVAEHTMVDEQIRSLLQLSPVLYYHHNTAISSQKKIVPLYSKAQRQQSSSGLLKYNLPLAEGALSRRMKRIKYKRGTIRIRRNGRIINVSTLLSSLNPPAVEKEKGL